MPSRSPVHGHPSSSAHSQSSSVPVLRRLSLRLRTGISGGPHMLHPLAFAARRSTGRPSRVHGRESGICSELYVECRPTDWVFGNRSGPELRLHAPKWPHAPPPIDPNSRRPAAANGGGGRPGRSPYVPGATTLLQPEIGDLEVSARPFRSPKYFKLWGSGRECLGWAAGS